MASRVELAPLASAPSVAAESAPARQAFGAPVVDPQDLLERLRRVRLEAKAAVALGSQGSPAQRQEVGARMVRGDGVIIRRRWGSGSVVEIKGALPYEWPKSLAPGEDLRLATARSFLRSNAPLLRLLDPDRELMLTAVAEDSLGLVRVRFAQQYQGLTVWPAELSVHLDRRGQVYRVTGTYVPTPRRLAIVPSVTAEEAVHFARLLHGATGSDETTVPELLVVTRDDGSVRLAWSLEVETAFDQRWRVLVDAHQGIVLRSFSTIESAAAQGSGVDLAGQRVPLSVWQENGQFWLVDTSKPMFDASKGVLSPDVRGAIVTLDARNQPRPGEPWYYVSSGSATSWPLPDAVSGSFNASQVYDYFLEQHGRNSLDGRGGTFLTVVRVDSHLFNAFWNSSHGGIFFGDAAPFVGIFDVVAHEMTHGVNSSSANLVYMDQSGALSESIADVFGESAEAWFEGSADWTMAAGVPSVQRSFIAPELFDQPRRMRDYVVTLEDNGGVHINSGIPNHAYYLLAEGLPGAIGLRDAEKIFYRALTVYLQSSSDFLDARLACVQAAEDLFGPGSVQVSRTKEAFDAVGITDAPPPPRPADAPAVNGSDATLFVFVDATTGAWRLGRRENRFGDGERGVILSSSDVSPARPSVTGDGSLAFFVDDRSDACFVDTETGEQLCVGVPGAVAAVAMSADGLRYAFILQNAQGQRDNRITFIDLATDSAETFSLQAAAVDGESNLDVLFADAMAFTRDGSRLVYDAFNRLSFANGSSRGVWSIYALDLISRNVISVVPPVAEVDVTFPAIANTNDLRLTFEVYDAAAGETTVYTGDLYDGTLVAAAVVDGAGVVPGFTGDDRGLVLGVPDATPTGASLWRVALSADKLSPVGQFAPWLEDAAAGVIYRRGRFRPPTSGCVDSDTEICLNRGRFKVELFWKTPNGQPGGGQQRRLTGDTGYFWFFSEDNVEAVVKVLDACSFADRFWVFAAGLTNVQATLRVTDTVTNAVRIYQNPEDTPFQPIQDTNAFATCAYASATPPGSLSSSSSLPSSVAIAGDRVILSPQRAAAARREIVEDLGTAHPVAEGANLEKASACQETDTTLCLGGARFRVSATWRSGAGQSGTAEAVRITGDTGYFWFFGADNVEIVVKVLDACSFADRFWVFAGGLTNVEVEMRVEDTVGGSVKTYRNRSNTPFQPIQDTAAFPTCP